MLVASCSKCFCGTCYFTDWLYQTCYKCKFNARTKYFFGKIFCSARKVEFDQLSHTLYALCNNILKSNQRILIFLSLHLLNHSALFYSLHHSLTLPHWNSKEKEPVVGSFISTTFLLQNFMKVFRGWLK